MRNRIKGKPKGNASKEDNFIGMSIVTILVASSIVTMTYFDYIITNGTYILLSFAVAAFGTIYLAITSIMNSKDKFETFTRAVEVLILLFGGYIIWKQFVMELPETASIIGYITSV